MRGIELRLEPSGRAEGLPISPRSRLISAGVVLLTLGLASGLHAGRTRRGPLEFATEREKSQAEFAASSIEHDNPQNIRNPSRGGLFR